MTRMFMFESVSLGIPPVLRLPVCAIAFLLGVIGLQLQAQLIPLYWSWLLIPLLLSIAYYKRHYWSFFIVAGFFWANLYGWSYLQSVPDESVAGQDIVVTGVIADLPIQQSRSIKFRFDIKDFDLDGYEGPVPNHIRLSWYYSKSVIKVGERWQFVVRIKPPSGFQNPGGFDYEAWLFQQNIQATGYIRKSPLNKRIQPAGWKSLVNTTRSKIRDFINTHSSTESASLLNALAIGYRGDMSAELWQVFIRTGTNHLIAISGLHIALIASFIWGLLRFLSKFKVLTVYLTLRTLILLSFAAAFAYAALAGFTIPTQRALIMLGVVYLGLYFYRQINVNQSLSLALILVLIISPTSVLSVGFWLSFLAVGAIAYSIIGRLNGRPKLVTWLWPQVVVIVALMPLSFYFFQQSSIVAVLSNIVAIPLVGLLILPALLLSLLLAPFLSGLSALLFNIADYALFYLVAFLRYLSDIEFSIWVHSEPSVLAIALAMFGLIVLFLPYGFPARVLSVFLLLPLLVNKTIALENGVYELHVLDVGQGLSIFIKTAQHQLLFDAGSHFSERFDIGEKVVVPFLRAKGVNELDRLMVSNGDNDHIGGAQAVLDNIETESVVGRDIQNLVHENIRLCVQGEKWQWDGVSFEILHPQHQRYRKRNNYSCVLKIDNGFNSVLIAADIEKKVEKELVIKQAKALDSNILIVPHHGSKTSSTLGFLQAVNPQIAIYSAGYLNRYHFPKEEIVKRYTDLAIMQLNTAKSGHISVIIDKKSLKDKPVSYRQQYQRYWHRVTDVSDFN